MIQIETGAGTVNARQMTVGECIDYMDSLKAKHEARTKAEAEGGEYIDPDAEPWVERLLPEVNPAVLRMTTGLDKAAIKAMLPTDLETVWEGVVASNPVFFEMWERINRAYRAITNPSPGPSLP